VDTHGAGAGRGELGLHLDKAEQTGDRARRPLTARQLDDAALDAEVLLRLYRHFQDATAEA
jgi:ribonuclease D